MSFAEMLAKREALLNQTPTFVPPENVDEKSLIKQQNTLRHDQTRKDRIMNKVGKKKNKSSN